MLNTDPGKCKSGNEATRYCHSYKCVNSPYICNDTDC